MSKASAAQKMVDYQDSVKVVGHYVDELVSAIKDSDTSQAWHDSLGRQYILLGAIARAADRAAEATLALVATKK